MEVIEVTQRESKVLELMSKGFSILDIAEELYCSDTTVRRDYESLYTKFAVNKHRELKDKYKNENIQLKISTPKAKWQRKHKTLNTSVTNIKDFAEQLCC